MTETEFKNLFSLGPQAISDLKLNIFQPFHCALRNRSGTTPWTRNLSGGHSYIDSSIYRDERGTISQ